MADVTKGFSAMEDGIWILQTPVKDWDLGKSVS